jgi:hypothetical protein
MPSIGEFEIDPTTIQEEQLLEKNVEHVLLIDKAERKIGKESGNPYINLFIKSVDHPGTTFFQVYGLSAAALSKKSSGISFKKFLDKLALPYTTKVEELVGLRFVATVRHQGQGDEAEVRLDSIKGRAE